MNLGRIWLFGGPRQWECTLVARIVVPTVFHFGIIVIRMFRAYFPPCKTVNRGTRLRATTFHGGSFPPLQSNVDIHRGHLRRCNRWCVTPCDLSARTCACLRRARVWCYAFATMVAGRCAPRLGSARRRKKITNKAIYFKTYTAKGPSTATNKTGRHA